LPTLLCVLLAAAGVGGLWASFYARLLASRPLLPGTSDPMLAHAMAHHKLGGGGH
jgi:hypothetical protein